MSQAKDSKRGDSKFLLIVFGVTGLVMLIVVLATALRPKNKENSTPLSAISASNSSASTPSVPSPAMAKTPGTVYQTDFTQAVGAEWSTVRVSTTPNKRHRFLGPFRDAPLAFAVGGLPSHQFIRLTFDLITYDRWNGDSGDWGRDLWDLRVVGGQPLIHTTFSNCGFFNNNNEQSFPDQYPWYPTHEAWTGAAKRQSLGWRTSQGQDSWGCDSTYAFDLIFPHSGPTLQLQFKSQIKNRENKPYGLLNFKVATVDHAATASEQTLAGWWNDLADEDAVKAYQATWSLIATGDAATTYIRDHLPPAATDGTAPPLNIDQTAQWQYGTFSLDTPQARQRQRAIHVLEVIHTDAARGLLTQIGYQGTPAGAPPDPFGG